MNDPIPIAEFERQKRVKVKEVVVEADPRAPEFSDEALTTRFVDRYGEELRYVAAWSRWLQWAETHWRLDDTLLAWDLARGVCRDAAAEISKPTQATSVASAKTMAAVERLARADRKIAATTDQWDADPWALNTPDGTVDLKTGKLRAHEPRDYLTKQTAVGPAGDCPLWMAFLDRVTNGDTDLAAFLQIVAGYALTGNTSEHALFFCYGTGANGKSVFLETLAGILGDYHKTAPIETFTASSMDRHPTDLAGLRGARLVTAVETEEGRRWAEARIKQLTGGDRISARFMRQDFFEFVPQFKLIIGGNHRPGLRSVDEAMRRRFNLIPFTVTIPEDERDPALKEKLKTEWPGILNWAIRGCLAWQDEGLNPPATVRDATADYMAGEDAVSAWQAECCELDITRFEASADLYASWKTWADKNGEHAGTAKSLASKLETRGFHPKRNMNSRGYLGYRLVSGPSA